MPNISPYLYIVYENDEIQLPLLISDKVTVIMRYTGLSRCAILSRCTYKGNSSKNSYYGITRVRK